MKHTMLKALAACSINPIKPLSLKYFPVQIPSSSGETTSSETALSSRTFRDMCYKLTQPMNDCPLYTQHDRVASDTKHIESDATADQLLLRDSKQP